MARLYQDFASGELTANATAGAVSLTSDGFASLVTVQGGDYVWIVLDPHGVGNGPELVKVTTHGVGATTATTLATVNAHNSGTKWVAPAVAEDFQRLDPLEAASADHGQRLGSVEANSWVTTARIQDGAVTSAKLAAAAQQALMPTGALTPYAGTSAPGGWLLCDGAAVSRTTYAALFAVVGVAYGAGNGSTTFNLPDLRGRVPTGRDTGQTEFDVLGETGGQKSVTLTEAQLPSHGHSAGTLATSSSGAHTHDIDKMTGQTVDTVHGHTIGNTVAQGGAVATGFVGAANVTVTSAGAHTHTVTGSVAAAGSGQAHDNLAPYVVTNYIIKT
jgi:microcystin-dependent protein